MPAVRKPEVARPPATPRCARPASPTPTTTSISTQGQGFQMVLVRKNATSSPGPWKLNHARRIRHLLEPQGVRNSNRPVTLCSIHLTQSMDAISEQKRDTELNAEIAQKKYIEFTIVSLPTRRILCMSPRSEVGLALCLFLSPWLTGSACKTLYKPAGDCYY